jgi:tetratricopeptide (TPR) repeat protein
MILRRLLLCVSLLGGAAPSLLGQSAEQMFQQGNMLYQQGKLAEARESYETIINNGYVSGGVYYNLGNTYYKTGNVAKAILNYERALRLMPNDEDLRHNLQLANMLITDKIEPTPRLFLWDYWEGVRNAFSMQSITWSTYACFVLMIAAFSVVIVARTYAVRKIAMLGGFVGTLVFFVFLVVMLGKISDQRRINEAIVTASITTAKNSPDGNSTDAFVLHAGVKVQMIDHLKDWVKVRLADGKVGWLEVSATEGI